MEELYVHENQPLQLSKFLDGGIARTFTFTENSNSVCAVRFDHNIQLDEGFYSMSIKDNIYSTSTASTRYLHSSDGLVSIYMAIGNETEKAVSYDCTPKFKENREGNRKSHFVHYSPASSTDGKRQTFNFAYCAAINAVKEIFTDDYMLAKYGVVLEDAEGLQVRTLKERFLPTDEFTRTVLSDDSKYNSNFRIILLCILSLYFLEKTFCLDQLEVDEFDLNCKTLMMNFNARQRLLFNDEDWHIYLEFLRLISIGCTYVRNISNPNLWDRQESSQKKFYYDMSFKPISYQHVAIGDSQLNLRSNMMRIVEDIYGILGYNSKLLGIQYQDALAKHDIKNTIIDYYIYPNMIHSKAYNDCVEELCRTLYSYKDISRVSEIENSINRITVDGSLVNQLAKEIIRSLYKIYPRKFANYIKRCRTELEAPRLTIAKEAVTMADYFKITDKYQSGFQFNENGRPQFLGLGYTLTQEPTTERELASYGLNTQVLTHTDLKYFLRNSPAVFFAKSKTDSLLNDVRQRENRIIGASYYEILVEVVNNLIAIGFNSRMKGNKIELNAQDIIASMYNCLEVITDPRLVNLIKAIIRDLSENPVVYKVTRIITDKVVTVEIEANVFLLTQIAEGNIMAFLKYSAELNNSRKQTKGGTFAQINSILPEEYYSEEMSSMYKNLTEAARQFLGFFGHFVSGYTKSYMSKQGRNDVRPLYYEPDDMVSFQTGGSPDATLNLESVYNYECTPVFSFDKLNNSKETMAGVDLSFLSMYQGLLKYVGMRQEEQDSQDSFINISECDITAHVEELAVFMKDENGNDILDNVRIWEPHTFKTKVGIPYPEYQRLLNQGGQYNTIDYTLVVEKTGTNVRRW